MFLPLMAFLAPAALAFMLLQRFWPPGVDGRRDLWLKAGLAGPLGAGLASGCYFVWALLFTPAGHWMVGVELLLFAAAIAWLWFDLKTRRPHFIAPPVASGAPVWGWIIFAVAAGIGLFAFVNFMFRNPHGLWDAWAIWNLRARFLYRATTFWTDTFSPDLFWSSPDYPLCLPGMIANAWKYVGSESLWVPMTTALLFSAATVVVLVSGLRKLSGGRTALIGGLALIGTPLFITHGASQYADVPLGFFMLAALVLLGFYDSPQWSRPGWLVWAGACVALAAWTKNEGLLFLAVVLGVRIVFGLKRRGLRPALRELMYLLIGAAPILALVFILKAFLVPTNGLFAIQDWSAIVDKLADPSRYWVVLRTFSRQILWYGHGMSIAVLASIVIVWPLRGRRLAAGFLPGLIVLLLMLIGYFFIYIITPQNLTWHLNTSIHRLLLQLWPSAIFLAASVMDSE